ncbi:hypothetical protein FB451DRAFT_1537118 [Mycena latifolia]|nr:hypothetical protein FB451DRAFT_1537118 [Mycena latifolia]
MLWVEDADGIGTESYGRDKTENDPDRNGPDRSGPNFSYHLFKLRQISDKIRITPNWVTETGAHKQTSISYHILSRSHHTTSNEDPVADTAADLRNLTLGKSQETSSDSNSSSADTDNSAGKQAMQGDATTSGPVPGKPRKMKQFITVDVMAPSSLPEWDGKEMDEFTCVDEGYPPDWNPDIPEEDYGDDWRRWRDSPFRKNKEQ